MGTYGQDDLFVIVMTFIVLSIGIVTYIVGAVSRIISHRISQKKSLTRHGKRWTPTIITGGSKHVQSNKTMGLTINKRTRSDYRGDSRSRGRYL